MSYVNQMLSMGISLLERWLAVQPPPFYVERILQRPNNPALCEQWEGELRRIGIPSEYFHPAITIKTSNRRAIVAINHLVYRGWLNPLNQAIEYADEAIAVLENSGDSDRLLRAHDLRAYALTERKINWVTQSNPLHQIARANPNEPDVQECLAECEKVLALLRPFGENGTALAKKSIDLALIYHRVNYNIGRILHEMSGDLSRAFEHLTNAHVTLEICTAVAGNCIDERSARLRLEVIYRLLEVASQDRGRFLGQVLLIGQYLKDPCLSKHSAGRANHESNRKEALSTKPQRKVALEDTAPLMPSIFDPDDLMAYLACRKAAILDLTITDRSLIATLIHGQGVSICKNNPDAVAAEHWDRFFRPLNVQYGAKMATLATHAFAQKIGMEPKRLTWYLQTDAVRISYVGENLWDVHRQSVVVHFDQGVPWERRLYDLLIGTFETNLRESGIEHLVIVPDLALRLVPFQVLRDQQGVHLCDRFRISYASSINAIVENIRCGRSRQAVKSVLIVQDPSGALPMSEYETACIQRHFSGASITILDDTNATSENIAEAVRSADILHFSTHGRFVSEEPEQSGIEIKDGRWLTLREIRQLEIASGALVFLSACDTGRLKLTSRIETMGIVPAFLDAGASTVVSTFWAVEDRSTALVAGKYYENLVHSGIGRLESLAKALSWLRCLSAQDINQIIEAEPLPDSNQCPFTDEYYWGAFALYGVWD